MFFMNALVGKEVKAGKRARNYGMYKEKNFIKIPEPEKKIPISLRK